MKTAPKRRFFNFCDTWKKTKVKEIFEVTRGEVLAVIKTSPVQTDKMKYPVYSSQTEKKGLLGFYDKYLFKTGITWTTDGANAGTVNFRPNKFYCTNVCGVLLSNDGYANPMVAEALNNVALGYVSYVGNPKLMNNVMAEIEIFIPSLKEQKAIGDFFQILDNIIATQQKKIDKLSALKSGYLFSMIIQNDKSFDKKNPKELQLKRKKVKLRELFENVPSKNFISTITKDGKHIVIQQGDVPELGKANDTPYYNYKNIILFGDHTLSIYKVNQPFLVATDAVKILESKVPRSYLYVLLEAYLPKSEGYKRHFSLLKNRVVEYTDDKKNQKAIGNFFETLDHLIELNEKKLNKLEDLKKAFLNEMFV